MNVRLLTQLLAIGSLLGLIALVQSGRGTQSGMPAPGDPAGAHEAFTISLDAETYDALPPLNPVAKLPEPLGLDQQGCQQAGGIVRVESENFESRSFPPRGGNWNVSDLLGARPGFIDNYMWGQVTCEASLGEKSLWAVGGGIEGSGLDCSSNPKGYAPTRPNGKGVRTLLRYGPLDLNISNAVGPRFTFDYLAKMPAQSLLIGVADGSTRESEGRVNYTGYNYFTPDTGGKWVRGEVINYANGSEFDDIVAGFKRRDQIEIGIFYTDPLPAGEGPPTAGMFGVFLDNIHIDVKTVARPCPIASPTATIDVIPPTNTPFVTATDDAPPTATDKPVVIPTPANTPTLSPAFMPLLQKMFRHRHIDDVIVVPTAPTLTPSMTPTPSLTPTPSSTPSPRPSFTPTSPPTPTHTPRPTVTPFPIPKIVISYMLPVTYGQVDLEYLQVTNIGTGPQLLDGWRIFADRDVRQCYFPAGVNLQPEDTYEVRSGRDAKPGLRMTESGESFDGFVCKDRLMWDNNNDRAMLYDEFDELIHKYCYDLDGPFGCFAP